VIKINKRADYNVEKDYSGDSDISINQILLSLVRIEKAEDLDLISEIPNPDALAKLYLVKEICKMKKYMLCEKAINIYIEKLLRYYISKNRESRREIVQSVRSLRERETLRMTLGEKALTNLAKG